MIIKVERNGGLAGIPISNEMDAKDLPTPLLTKVKRIMENPNLASIPLKTVPRGSADYYAYKISIQDGAINRVIECNQYNLQDDLKSLIRYLEKSSKKRN